jgi:hypothetical protein
MASSTGNTVGRELTFDIVQFLGGGRSDGSGGGSSGGSISGDEGGGSSSISSSGTSTTSTSVTSNIGGSPGSRLFSHLGDSTSSDGRNSGGDRGSSASMCAGSSTSSASNTSSSSPVLRDVSNVMWDPAACIAVGTDADAFCALCEERFRARLEAVGKTFNDVEHLCLEALARSGYDSQRGIELADAQVAQEVEAKAFTAEEKNAFNTFMQSEQLLGGVSTQRRAADHVVGVQLERCAAEFLPQRTLRECWELFFAESYHEKMYAGRCPDLPRALTKRKQTGASGTPSSCVCGLWWRGRQAEGALRGGTLVLAVHRCALHARHRFGQVRNVHVTTFCAGMYCALMALMCLRLLLHYMLLACFAVFTTHGRTTYTCATRQHPAALRPLARCPPSGDASGAHLSTHAGLCAAKCARPHPTAQARSVLP